MATGGFFKNVVLVVFVIAHLSVSAVADTECGNNGKACITRINGTNSNETKVTYKEKPRPPVHGKPKPEHKYPLVPPFLIGAAVVMLVYCVFQCIYVHCYAKKNLRPKARAPTIIIHSDSQDGTLQQITPMVRLEGGQAGKTEVVAAHPYLICQPLDCDDDFLRPDSRRSSMKSRLSLQVPAFVRRLSRSSQSQEPPTPVSDGSSGSNPSTSGDRRRSRASICFLPVGQTIPGTSTNGASGSVSPGVEWTQLQGYVYSSFVLNRKPSYKNACLDGNLTEPLSPTEDNKVYIFPNYSTFQRSMSQTSAASMGKLDEEEQLLVPEIGPEAASSSNVPDQNCEDAPAESGELIRSQPCRVSFNLEREERV